MCKHDRTISLGFTDEMRNPFFALPEGVET